MSWQQFEALYMLHLQAPDNPSAHIAYMRTEAAVVAQHGEKKFSSYESFRNMLSQQRKKSRPVTEDPEETCQRVISIANAYLSQVDIQYVLAQYRSLADQVRHMEAFGSLQKNFDPVQHETMKRRVQTLHALIQYINTI